MLLGIGANSCPSDREVIVRIRNRALLLGLICAVCFWLLDSVFCFFFFYDEPFLDLLILNITPHHLSIRLLALLLCIVFALIGTRHDAQRRQAEEALKTERDFAEGLIQTAQAIILVLDTQGRIVEVITSFISKDRDQWVLVGSKTDTKVIFCLYASGIGRGSVDSRTIN